MYFFERQDEARRRTGVLIALFALAVLSLVGLLEGLLWLAFVSLGAGPPGPAWLGCVALSVLTMVALGSGLKSLQMRAGGGALAKRLGGRRIDPASGEADERRLIHVAEEMAIAAGLPVPDLYVLDREPAINAFAAGWTPDDAAIGVSAGALSGLTRAELAGVVAHETSHVLAGDMRLNLRLIGVLYGIQLLSEVGARVAVWGAAGGRGRKRGGLWVVGAVVWAVGSLGWLLGELIKAAVSRQREHLADASAVQLTRDPRGLGGALVKIGASPLGSIVNHPCAREVSHLWFARGVPGWLGRWTATHPPLRERVRWLMPDFTGAFPSEVRRVAAADGGAGVAALHRGGAAGEVELEGAPRAAHLAYARALLEGLVPTLRAACHDPVGAQAVVFGLLLGPDPAAHRAREAYLRGEVEAALWARYRELDQASQGLDVRARLPLLDLCLPALRRLTQASRERFLVRVLALVRLDGQVTLFEWTLWRVLRRHLRGRRPLRTESRVGVRPAASVLLSFVAHAGARTPPEAEAAYAAGACHAGLGAEPLRPLQACGLAALDAALDRLEDATPRRRDALMQALAACVAHDGRVTAREAEALRAATEALGGAAPPWLPGQSLLAGPLTPPGARPA